MTEVRDEAGELWYYSPSGYRQRLSTHNAKNTNRMFVNGVYIPRSHPLWKPGRYSSFSDAAFENLARDKTCRKGYVYAIVNPAWPDWVKVGMAIDVDDRCNGYQTSSPFRDYEILYSCYVSDRRKAERASHKRAEKLALERSGEWFKIDHALVREAIKGAVEKYSITALLK